MVKKENTSVVASDAEKIPGTSNKKREQTFSVSTLRGNCVKLFGCTTSTFDGAFFDCADKEYTIEEANGIIKKWLGEEMK